MKLQILFIHLIFFLNMKIWLKLGVLLLIVILFANCASQKQIIYNIINDLEFNENMGNEKFDIDLFNKNQKNDSYKYTLDDGTYIELLKHFGIGPSSGFTEWRHPANKFYQIYKSYYPNLNLERKGLVIDDQLDIGIWEYYDEQGNLVKKVNEDEKFGKFDYNRLFLLLNRKGYIDIQKGNWKDVVGVGFDNEKKLWYIEVKNKDGHRKLVINEKEQIVKTIKVYEIE